jgi:hypothetical protein
VTAQLSGWDSRAILKDGLRGQPASADDCPRPTDRAARSRAVISGGVNVLPTVSLHGMHAGRAWESLVGGLHTFCGGLHAEPAAETDHRVHDGGGIGCLLD